MNRGDPPSAPSPDLVVTGHQFWWEAQYPASGALSANEIHIPVGKPLSVRLDSKDVLHEFWVPELARKMTAAPGQPNHIWLQADKPGVYIATYSEFCGTQHAWMRILVVADEPSRFEQWERAQLQPGQAATGDAAAKGLALFQTSTCINCPAIRGDAAFILHEDGLGWLYVASGLQDGPMPTHYEPLESPVHNALYSRDTNPAVHSFTRQENRFAPPGDPRFPFFLTTYRLTEHHTAGGMSRFLSHLAELQPELFAEISPELAVELKIAIGDHISIVSLRGAIEARALVSRRIRPLHLNGKTVHQIAMAFHFGSAGPVKGGATNDLVPISGEPNVTIMEAKALTCNIVPGRLPRGPTFEDWLNKYVPKGGPANLHPEQPPPGAPCVRAGGGHGLEGKIDTR